jgi:hypothetical protein
MSHYPEVVDKIVQDYLERVKAHLQRIPQTDRDEFVKEISSHVFESYNRASQPDEVSRILVVLRNLGEPAELVAEKLPDAMVAFGRTRRLPLYVLGGVLIGLFGLPLGFAGVAVILGALGAISGLVVAYLAVAGAVVVTGVIGMGLGLLRLLNPELWDQLVAQGFIHINGRLAELFDLLSPASQGASLVFFFMAVSAIGLGMLWVGKRMLRGLRFLFNLIFERVTQFIRKRPRALASHLRTFSPLMRQAPQAHEWAHDK